MSLELFLGLQLTGGGFLPWFSVTGIQSPAGWNLHLPSQSYRIGWVFGLGKSYCPGWEMQGLVSPLC